MGLELAVDSISNKRIAVPPAADEWRSVRTEPLLRLERHIAQGAACGCRASQCGHGPERTGNLRKTGVPPIAKVGLQGVPERALQHLYQSTIL